VDVLTIKHIHTHQPANQSFKQPNQISTPSILMSIKYTSNHFFGFYAMGVEPKEKTDTEFYIVHPGANKNQINLHDFFLPCSKIVLPKNRTFTFKTSQLRFIDPHNFENTNIGQKTCTMIITPP
jgi:hypothetical protein